VNFAESTSAEKGIRTNTEGLKGNVGGFLLYHPHHRSKSDAANTMKVATIPDMKPETKAFRA